MTGLETLKIFDHNGKHIGEASREEIHKLGHWHETFHFWLLSKEDNNIYIYFQLRSDVKKDYPSLLDITAAGHLLANEDVEDGIREVKEEIGLDYTLDQLKSLGILRYSMREGNLIDNELAHVFIYLAQHEIPNFVLQEDEVAGIYKATFTSFYELWLGEIQEIEIEGFEIDGAGKQVKRTKTVNRSHFVPHAQYFKDVANMINQEID